MLVLAASLLGQLIAGAALLPTLLALLPLPALYAAAGLYPGFGLQLPERLRRRMLIATGWLALASTTTALFADAVPLLVSGLAFALLAPLAEDLTRLVLHRQRRWGKPALVSAPPQQLSQACYALLQNWQLGLLPTLTATPCTAMVLAAGAEVASPPLHSVEMYLLRDGGQLFKIRDRQSKTIRQHPARAPYATIKRAMDVGIGSVALLLSLPLLLVCAALVYRRDPGPVLLRQARRSQHGKPVMIWKLRSMYQDSEARLQTLLADPVHAAAWQRHFKLEQDPRILPGIGPFIRAYSIDELPQLWNVICGELTLVGPRAFLDYDLAVYSADELAIRQSVKAGLTGLWQVSVRSDGENRDKVRYDLAYVNGWSLWSDLDILYRTIGVVLGGHGAR
jgi:lipopolysaccharide/colanic/teichoic acid biosynthesis glycosyltransferase